MWGPGRQFLRRGKARVTLDSAQTRLPSALLSGDWLQHPHKSLYDMAPEQCAQPPSAPADPQPRIADSVFGPMLVELTHAKSQDVEGLLYGY